MKVNNNLWAAGPKEPTMSGYENAPATRFVATRCAVCGRALVDAVSVQAAMGPDCRHKYGYDNAPGPADWAAVECFLLNFGAEVKADNPEVVGCRDARRVANVLVHRFARNFRTARWIPDAVFALGFPKVAERLARRARVKLGTPQEPPAVKVTKESYTDTWKGKTSTRTVYVVKAPFSPEFNAARVPGRWWDKGLKAWRVREDAKRELWNALKACFKGLPLTAPDGTTTTIA